MKKKTYVEPSIRQIALRGQALLGPVASQQWDDSAHFPLGKDNGKDAFMSRELDYRAYSLNWFEDE
jgi:hypothetical protein